MYQEEIQKILKKGLVYNMNKTLKEFLHRGLMFSGFGPIIFGIILIIIENTTPSLKLSAAQILIGIISTYFLAFLQAGASVFNSKDDWSILKSTFFHFLTIYLAYVVCYLINSWIPFDIKVIAIFTLIFVISYFVIWLTVFLIIKATSKKLNSKL